MEFIIKTTDDKKDIVRATNAVTGAQDLANTPLKLYGVLVYDKADADGEEKRVTALKVEKEDGTIEFVTSISATVEQSVDTICSLYSNEEIAEGIDIMIRSKKSKANRDFYYIDLI